MSELANQYSTQRDEAQEKFPLTFTKEKIADIWDEYVALIEYVTRDYQSQNRKYLQPKRERYLQHEKGGNSWYYIARDQRGSIVGLICMGLSEAFDSDEILGTVHSEYLSDSYETHVDEFRGFAIVDLLKSGITTMATVEYHDLTQAAH